MQVLEYCYHEPHYGILHFATNLIISSDLNSYIKILKKIALAIVFQESTPVVVILVFTQNIYP